MSVLYRGSAVPKGYSLFSLAEEAPGSGSESSFADPCEPFLGIRGHSKVTNVLN